MAIRQLLRSTGVIALLFLGSGCSLYLPRPVTFAVRDGDTGQPIEGATVAAGYHVMLDFGECFGSVGPRTGKTDRDGNLTLIVDPDKSEFNVGVSVDGYSERDGTASLQSSRLVPGSWYAWRDEYHVNVYRGPHPTAEITFPDGYRGVVVVKFPAESTLPKVPGQRRFTYTASPRGLVDISETGLFEGVASEDCIRARYHDGTAIPNHHDPKLYDSAIALRRVVTEPFNRKNGKGKDHVWLYVLGTAAEAEAVHRSLWQADKPFDSVAFQRIVVSR